MCARGCELWVGARKRDVLCTELLCTLTRLFFHSVSIVRVEARTMQAPHTLLRKTGEDPRRGRRLARRQRRLGRFVLANNVKVSSFALLYGTGVSLHKIHMSLDLINY